jgi:ribosomal protein L11
MKKKKSTVKLQIPAAQANPAPPVEQLWVLRE